MRFGFFYGVAGDAVALEAALALLGDCDRVVSLGDLVAPSAGASDACLSWMAEADPRFLFLAGKSERARSHDRKLSQELRHRLRTLPTVEILEGVALHGGAHGGGGRPREASLTEPLNLVAPLTLAAGTLAAGLSGSRLSGSRLWRATGGLSRVEEVSGPMCFQLGGQKLRLDLGAAAPSASSQDHRHAGGPRVVQVAVVDKGAGLLKMRERVLGGGMASVQLPLQRRSPARRRIHEGQQMLAV